MRYPLIKYVDELKNGFHGMANGPFIRIVKGYKKDEGLYQHELVHVKQWFITLSLHSWIYQFSKKYRLRCEVAAYKEQLKYSKNPNRDRETFAMFICTRYNLDDLKGYEIIRMLT